jgi:serine/threonine-protein kinase HipA
MAGRPSKKKQLGIWNNGQKLGQWSVSASGESRLHYEESWLNSDSAHPLSLSLPLQVSGQPHRGQVVENYFDNLLPDSDSHRRKLAQHYQSQTTQVFDLLEQVGRDCVGAVQLLPEGATPQSITHIEGQGLPEAQIASMIRNLGSSAATSANIGGQAHDLRLSIAGAQDKTALLWHQGQWLLPHGATPTTHILKPPLGHIGMDRRLDMTTSVENEWLCLRILAAFGLEVPRAAMLQFEDQKVFVIERFDRQLHPSGQWWMRLPQEDFCQVTGTPSHLKYESEGGPGLHTIGTWLQGSSRRVKDLVTLLKTQVLFRMLAATDGHAKNFSIRLLPGAAYHLTPLYDVLSAWPVIGKTSSKIAQQKVKLAMALKGKNRHYDMAYIRREHFEKFGNWLGLFSTTSALIDDIIERTPTVIETVRQELPTGFPDQIFTSICENMALAARQLAR